MAANRSQEQVAAEAHQNRVRLLEAEAAALLLLRRRRDEAIRRGLRRGWSLRRITFEIEVSVRHAVIDLRKASRAAGVERLESELTTVGKRLKEGGTAPAAEVTRDHVRAKQLAKSYAARFDRKAAGTTKTEELAAAATGTDGSIRRIGVSESSEAFSSGRTHHLRLISSHRLLRIWDATLDARTCIWCAGADGTIVAMNEPFPLGEPGDVHPHCRCIWTLLTSMESADEILIQAA